MNEISLNMYTVVRRPDQTFIEHGLPFVAMTDDHAKKLTAEAITKEVESGVASMFHLVRIGTYNPRKNQPFTPCDPVDVCRCDELYLACDNSEVEHGE